ncbi:hypothetical protein [Rosettibacter firmus]|uniref:hypothetical protein n=1 Tax=Rosettibacter firmus TaxID=3111522 RepID=UPI00336BEC7C
MKTICMFFISIFTFFSLTFAQGGRNTELYINTGFSLPSQPETFSDYWNTGINIGGGLGFPFSSSLVFVGRVDYNNFSFDEEGFLKDNNFAGYGVSISGGSASIVTITGNLKANLISTPNSVSPYFVGGIGYFKMTIDEFTISALGESEKVEGDTESAFSVLFGVGVDIPAGETMSIYFEGKYGIGFTEDESKKYFPLNAGIKIKL